jgi:predicted HAD superfamily phosphohydrolase YqeG
VYELAELDAIGDVPIADGIVLVDLDNTLLPYGYEPEALTEAALAVGRLQRRLTASRPIVVISNGRASAAALGGVIRDVPVLGGARKPWRLSHPSDVAAVVGDQFLTDGLLAWRLDVPFVHVEGCSAYEHWWPRTMRRVGTQVARVLSSTDPDGTGDP